MISSSSKSRLGNLPFNLFGKNSSSKLKTYVFIVAIIASTALAIGIAGLTGSFHVNGISRVAQLDTIITMAAGAISIVTLLIIGIASVIKNRVRFYGPEASGPFH